MAAAIVWPVRILGWLCLIFLAFDATLHLWNPPFVSRAFSQLGFPDSLSPALGIIEVIAIVLSLVPRTAFLGVVLFTAYLGGATAIQTRVGGPAWFAVLCGAILWAAAYVQYPKVREVFAVHR